MTEPRKWEYISSYYRDRADADDSPVIYDRTWGDLDMDTVFLRIDRTRSSVGQGVLYDMLRRPLFDPSTLADREHTIDASMRDDRGRARIGGILRRLGMQRDGEVFQFLSFRRMRVTDRRRFIYLGLSVAPFVAVPAAVFLGLPGIAFLAIVMIVNLILHYRFKTVVTVESPSYEYLHRLLAAGFRLGRLSADCLASERARLLELSRSLRALRRRTALLATPTGMSGDILALGLEYVRQVFLQEVTTYFFVHNDIVARMADLVRLYCLVGTIDVLTGVATLRTENPGLVVPEIEEEGLVVDGDDLVHPLLAGPVPNSMCLRGRGVLITGSNMSGKSTFLRTLGVNQVLATTLRIAFARRLRITPLLTVTSITSRDNILTSESHYLVEAKRLLSILAAARSARPALIIIDEILSGTNSEERIAASIRILRHLSGLNCLVAAATHDRPIAAALEADFENLHFTHLVEGDGLEFDYRLRVGIVEAGNAIRLLRLLGYPAEILDEPS